MERKVKKGDLFLSFFFLWSLFVLYLFIFLIGFDVLTIFLNFYFCYFDKDAEWPPKRWYIFVNIFCLNMK